MPHLWVEYSANLADEINIKTLLHKVQAAFIDDGMVFPLAGARTRGIKIEDYVIVDDHPDNAFVHVLLKIGAGRSEEVKQAACQRVLEAVEEYFKEIKARRPLGI